MVAVLVFAVLALVRHAVVSAQYPYCPVRNFEGCLASTIRGEEACIARENTLASLFRLSDFDTLCCRWSLVVGGLGGTVNLPRSEFHPYFDNFQPGLRDEERGKTWQYICTNTRSVIYNQGFIHGGCSVLGTFRACLSNSDSDLYGCLCEHHIADTTLACMWSAFNRAEDIDRCDQRPLHSRTLEDRQNRDYYTDDFSELLAKDNNGNTVDIIIDSDGYPYYPQQNVYGAPLPYFEYSEEQENLITRCYVMPFHQDLGCLTRTATLGEEIPLATVPPTYQYNSPTFSLTYLGTVAAAVPSQLGTTTAPTGAPPSAPPGSSVPTTLPASLVKPTAKPPASAPATGTGSAAATSTKSGDAQPLSPCMWHVMAIFCLFSITVSI